MKCPKCGFNSFEYYDSCKKCSSDLTGYKQTYSVASVVLPSEAKERLVAELKSAVIATEQVSDTVEAHDDIFSFDLPDDPNSASSNSGDDPFNFNEPSPDESQENSKKSEEDLFADLLESTSQSDESSFTTTSASSVMAGASAKPAETPTASGEFDLESFSWDETSVAATSDSKEVVDDFDSLFGETKETSSK